MLGKFFNQMNLREMKGFLSLQQNGRQEQVIEMSERICYPQQHILLLQAFIRRTTYLPALLKILRGEE